MLCRLGLSELSRPVRATVWLNVAWIRPSSANVLEQRLAVGRAELLDLAVAEDVLDDRVLAAHLLERLGVGGVPGLGLLLPGVSPSSSKRTSRICLVELTLNGWPAASVMAARSSSASSGEAVAEAGEHGDVDPDADLLHLGQHPDERRLEVVVEGAETLGVHGLEQRHGEARRAERVAGRDERHRDGLVAAEVELAVGHGAVGRQLQPGVARRAGRPGGSSTRPDRAGTRPGWCRRSGLPCRVRRPRAP